MDALGTFVRLEQILKDSQFPNYVQHLNETDRQSAKSQLESQRDQLRSQLLSRIEMAYGIRGGGEDYLDDGNPLGCLRAIPQPRSHRSTCKPPAAANLEQGSPRCWTRHCASSFPNTRISTTRSA